MLTRSVIFASIAGFLALAAAPASADAPSAAAARCEQTDFRIYFRDGSAALDPIAMQTLQVAERNMADCAYAELHVTVDPTHALAAERGAAILAASTHDWDASRIEARSMSHRASFSDGPDFVAVTMTPHVMPVQPDAPMTSPDAGV